MSFFDYYSKAKPDPIFGLNAQIKADPRSDKIDLLIGYYKAEDGSVPIFEAVKESRKIIIENDKDLNYFPIDGHPGYIAQLKTLIFDHYASDVYGAQTVGGTSALHHIGKLLRQKATKIAIPNPTWANHKQIFDYLGFDVVYYPYYDRTCKTVDFEKLIHFLDQLPEASAVLLHASCHNPTGVDLTDHEWEELAKMCKQKKLMPFFDCAYHGLGEGLKEDLKSLHIFAQHVEEFFLAYSCSKNFGLYGERTGALFYFNKQITIRDTVSSIIKQSMRATYSNPPRHGALIVNMILESDHLKKLWMQELNDYQTRIKTIRAHTCKELEKLTGKNLMYIKQGHGLFSYTGLSEHEVIEIREKDAIYLASDGRFNLTSLNQKNFHKVVSALSKYL